MFIGFKDPLELHRNVEIAIREIPKFVRTVHRGNHVAAGWRFGTRETKKEDPCVRKSRVSETQIPEMIYTVDRRRGLTTGSKWKSKL